MGPTGRQERRPGFIRVFQQACTSLGSVARAASWWPWQTSSCRPGSQGKDRDGSEKGSAPHDCGACHPLFVLIKSPPMSSGPTHQGLQMQTRRPSGGKVLFCHLISPSPSSERESDAHNMISSSFPEARTETLSCVPRNQGSLSEQAGRGSVGGERKGSDFNHRLDVPLFLGGLPPPPLLCSFLLPPPLSSFLIRTRLL